MVGFLLACLAPVVVTGRQATYGSFPITSLVSLAAGFFLAVGWGMAVGRLIPSVVAPFVALAGVYLTTVFLDTGSPGLRPFSAVIVADPREHTYLAPVPWVDLLRTLFLVSLAVLLVAAATRIRRARLIATVVAVLSVTVLLYVGEDSMRVQASALRPVCTGQEPTVCITAARDHVADNVQHVGSEFASALPGLFPSGLTLSEESLQDGRAVAAAGSFVIPFSVVNGTHGEAHEVDRNALLILLANRVLRDPCQLPKQTMQSDGTVGRIPANVDNVIERWLLSDLRVDLTASNLFDVPDFSDGTYDWSAVSAFANSWDKATGGQRRAWLSRNHAAVQTCRVPQSVPPVV